MGGGFPLLEAQGHGWSTLRFHPVNFNVRPDLFERGAKPRAQTASTNGQDHGIQFGYLVGKFQSGSAGALQSEETFKRMDESPAFFQLSAVNLRLAQAVKD